MASYELQRVLPANFQPPRVRGMGVAPGPRPIISGSVPAYPVLLPTIASFSTALAQPRARMIPSVNPAGKRYLRRGSGARIFPVSAAGRMPGSSTSYHPTFSSSKAPVGYTPMPMPMAGLAAYMDSPAPWPLTATWGLGAYRPKGLGSCGCPGSQGTCSCGMGGLGDFDLGQITLPVVGEVDIKSVVLVVGAVLLVRKVLGAGRKVRSTYGIRRPIYRREVEA